MERMKRFEVKIIEGISEIFRVIVDTETGVNYLYISNGVAGGLSVLLNSDGKPVVTPYK
ncbi:xylan 1,4-beta-xylosidase (plasmid) [Clostridiaceae bacterium 14S0207]|nr:xylan 1,4-beta-xylosidase [Clostridiaceae bacterium 14S0207]